MKMLSCVQEQYTKRRHDIDDDKVGFHSYDSMWFLLFLLLLHAERGPYSDVIAIFEFICFAAKWVVCCL